MSAAQAASSEIQTMGKAGYTLAEMAKVPGSALSMTQTVTDLKASGDGALAWTEYVHDHYGSQASDLTTASLLVSAGYGSCSNLEPVVASLEQVHGDSQSDLWR